jgi:hypothetical protein
MVQCGCTGAHRCLASAANRERRRRSKRRRHTLYVRRWRRRRAAAELRAYDAMLADKRRRWLEFEKRTENWTPSKETNP